MVFSDAIGVFEYSIPGDPELFTGSKTWKSVSDEYEITIGKLSGNNKINN